MKVIDARLPNDPSGTAVGVAFADALVDPLLEGLRAVANTVQTLSEKAGEIRKELVATENPLAGKGMRLVKIDRQIDLEALKTEKKLRAIDCDRRKVLALAAALLLAGKAGIGILEGTLGTLVRGGIPIKLEGNPKVGESVFIRLFDESLEVKIVWPA